MISKCIYCEKEFKHSPSHKRKYCSLECRNKSYKFREDITECEWCGNDIKQTRSRVKKYCSVECRKQKLEHNAKDRNRRYCEGCGKMYVINPRSRKVRKYCSRVCAVIKECKLIRI